jgi:hypothetical protein
MRRAHYLEDRPTEMAREFPDGFGRTIEEACRRIARFWRDQSLTASAVQAAMSIITQVPVTKRRVEQMAIRMEVSSQAQKDIAQGKE